MGGRLDFVELWDVVEDGEEDDWQDVHIAAADLGTKYVWMISNRYICHFTFLRRDITREGQLQENL